MKIAKIFAKYGFEKTKKGRIRIQKENFAYSDLVPVINLKFILKKIFFLGMNPKKYKKLIDEVVGDEEYMPTDQVLQQNLCHCPDFANFHNFLSST